MTRIQKSMKRASQHFGCNKRLAHVCGVTPPQVSKWISGTTKPGLRSLLRLENETAGEFKAKAIRPELF